MKTVDVRTSGKLTGSPRRVLTFDEIYFGMPRLESYKPSNPTLWGLDY